LRRSAPGHVAAVRKALFDRLDGEQQRALGEIMRTIADGLQPTAPDSDLPWLR
ncbi:MarR family transcriptional regulator, partial [Streptomyces sp. SID11233]|nr:MarR family transcriptional regulator [Streptomyces sp. SID11233]